MLHLSLLYSFRPNFWIWKNCISSFFTHSALIFEFGKTCRRCIYPRIPCFVIAWPWKLEAWRCIYYGIPCFFAEVMGKGSQSGCSCHGRPTTRERWSGRRRRSAYNGRRIVGRRAGHKWRDILLFIALGMLKAAADRKEKQLFSVAELSSFSLLCTTVVFRVRISGPPLNYVSDAQ